jgi:hypothetical protein
MRESSESCRGIFGGVEALRRRREAFEIFNRWEVAHPSCLGATEAVAAIGALYELLPVASRKRPVDPSGVQEMHRCLARLSPMAP